MAQLPTEELIHAIQEQTRKDIEAKAAAQHALGKDFVVEEDGHGPGVVPERDWQAMKNDAEEGA